MPPKKKSKDDKRLPDDVFDPVSVDVKQADTSVLMLSSPEEDVLCKATESLFHFASKCEENKLYLLKLGCLEGLVRLLPLDDRIIRRNATMVLGTLASHSEVRKALRQAEPSIVPTMVTLLGPEEEGLCHEFCSLWFNCMCQEHSFKAEAAEHRALEPLLFLLMSPDPDTQKNSVEAILHLVQDPVLRVTLRELNGLDVLLSLYKSDFPLIQETALKAIETCLLDAPSRDVFRELEGVDKTVSLLAKAELKDVHVYALSVLANCMEDPDTTEQMRVNGHLSKMLDMANHSDNNDVKLHTARILCKAAKNGDNRKILREQDVEKTLITLANTDDDRVKAAAADGLAVMAENAQARDAIRNQDGLDILLKLLRSDHPDTRRAAALAIANCSHGNVANAREVLAQAGIEQLLHLLAETDNPLAQAHAAMAIANMAVDEAVRADAIRRGATSALSTPLSSTHPDVQSAACVCLSSLCVDSVCRVEIKELSLTPLLVSLLSSPVSAVRRNACWAVFSCCVDAALCEAVAQAGGLRLLQALNQSDTRRSSMSMAAFLRVLDQHLPLKLAITGRLDSSDLIGDGFYDMGVLRPEQPVLSLEELSRQGPGQARTVLLVNCKDTQPVRAPSPLERSNDDVADSKSKKKPSKAKAKASPSGRKSTLPSRETDSEADSVLHSPDESPWLSPFDAALSSALSELSATLSTLSSTRDQLVSLAQWVCARMGGAVAEGAVTGFDYELALSELKLQLSSNVVPLGLVRRGISPQRALLFKAVADRLGLPCTLVRGQYNRSWNEVLLPHDGAKAVVPRPPTLFIVDLMHVAGRLLPHDSVEASNYRKL